MVKILLSAVLMLVTSSGFGAHAALLISLGMPDNVLTAYLKQGKQYHIPVVIRGLYTKKKSTTTYLGSFRETALRIKTLVRSSKSGGVSINPLLFRAFNVKAVPALVVYDDPVACLQRTAQAADTQCPENTFDAVLGNLPLSQLLAFVANHTSAVSRSDFVNTLLKKYSPKQEDKS